MSSAEMPSIFSATSLNAATHMRPVRSNNRMERTYLLLCQPNASCSCTTTKTKTKTETGFHALFVGHDIVAATMHALIERTVACATNDLPTAPIACVIPEYLVVCGGVVVL